MGRIYRSRPYERTQSDLGGVGVTANRLHPRCPFRPLFPRLRAQRFSPSPEYLIGLRSQMEERGKGCAMFVAVTKLDFDPHLKDDMIALARETAPIFRKQKGNHGVWAHVSTDGHQTMMYLLWETEQDHLACMQSVDFSETNPKFEALMKSGKVAFTLNTYDTLDT